MNINRFSFHGVFVEISAGGHELGRCCVPEMGVGRSPRLEAVPHELRIQTQEHPENCRQWEEQVISRDKAL